MLKEIASSEVFLVIKWKSKSCVITAP